MENIYPVIAIFLSIVPFIIRLTKAITSLDDTMRQNTKEHKIIFKMLKEHENRLDTLEDIK